jgi:hypothetical protein
MGLFSLNSFKLGSFDQVVERVEDVLFIVIGELLNIFQALQRFFIQYL